MRVVILSVLAGLVLSFTGNSQSLDEVVKVGNQSFDTKDYYNAFRCYEKVIDFIAKDKYKGDWDPLYIKFRYAESAQRFNYFEKADSVYTALLKESLGKNMDVYARSVFNLARVKQSLAGDTIALNVIHLDTDSLKKAEKYYQRFLDESLRQHLKIFPASGKEGPDPLSLDDQRSFDSAAAKGIEDCQAAIRVAIGHPEGVILNKDTISRLPDVVNSEYSDIAPVLSGNDLYFSSLKFPSKPGRLMRQSRIYSQVLKATYSRNARGELDAILAVDTLAQVGFFNDENDFSHTIHTAITHNGEWMYFSHCPQGRDGVFCSLYRRKKTGDAWGEPEYVSVNVDSTRFTTTQPSVSYDPRTGAQWLYFASDRDTPGAKGNLDIWRCRLNEIDGSLSDPEPQTEVNSEWNDATPFMHALSGRLFFSSDRGSTFGLYDNFVWKPAPNGNAIENMGVPYNGGYNDQYYFLTEDGGQAFFSSDRPQSTRFVDSLDACCQDIYTYPIDLHMDLEVEVYGCKEENITYNADVKIYDITYCDCRKGNLVESTSSGEGNASRRLASVKRYHTYKIIASHDKYVTDSITISLDWRYDGKESEQAGFQLSPAFVDLTFTVVDSMAQTPLEREDYTLAVTSEEGKPVSDNGNQTYRLNPKLNYTLEVKAENAIYTSKTIPLDRIQLTSNCTDERKIEMAPCFPDRLEGIIFYFDNDEPSRIVRSQWTTTKGRFDTDLVNPYYGKKEAYKNFNLDSIPISWNQVMNQVRLDTVLNFDNEVERIDTLLDLKAPAEQKGLESESLRYFVRKNKSGAVKIFPDPITVGGRIDRFFDRDLKGNLDKFNNFIAYIKNYLETGNNITIKMQAYCSKRVSGIYSNYNDSLAVRRINCIEATIKESLEESWKGLSTTERQKFGAFKIDSDPLGASGAAENFPDPNLDTDADEGGKYFLSAALDRRVEITSINIKSCKGDNALSTQTNTKILDNHGNK
ncbi:MAG: PD40 domain-containing protein [Phaeodactylibacter sp.]|nr:PD40 domain-containing protein [Phaeodactylibacter sp.]